MKQICTFFIFYNFFLSLLNSFFLLSPSPSPLSTAASPGVINIRTKQSCLAFICLVMNLACYLLFTCISIPRPAQLECSIADEGLVISFIKISALVGYQPFTNFCLKKIIEELLQLNTEKEMISLSKFCFIRIYVALLYTPRASLKSINGFICPLTHRHSCCC